MPDLEVENCSSPFVGGNLKMLSVALSPAQDFKN
jgi:hypothetical protein